MMSAEFFQDWSRRFGLAYAPMFERNEIDEPNNHSVLLDGAQGSFALSTSAHPIDSRTAASWAWSCGLPNHVNIHKNIVTITRWDRPTRAESFTLSSIEAKITEFYNFLNKNRPIGRRDVVATLLDLFRSVRAEVVMGGGEDSQSVEEFLSVLASLVSQDRSAHGATDRFMDQWTAERARNGAASFLSDKARNRLNAGFKEQIFSLSGLELSSSLAVRHAASAIFQEAHFAFEAADQTNLFGYQTKEAFKGGKRGLQHFTPPSLARSVVEQAIKSLGDITSRKSLAVTDPACGSGAFLTETLRALRRVNYAGSLTVVGRDISKSAIEMAQFALHAARHDWEPAGGLSIDLQVEDTLASKVFPAADLIVMNPPFLAWPMMTADQKEQVTTHLGTAARHRPDLCMVFITRALHALNNGGVIASLLPASMLSVNSAREWRSDLLEKCRLAFLGNFGDYSLFAHALVQVASIVLVNEPSGSAGTALKSSNDSDATGEALRALRRLSGPIVAGASGKGWRITPIDESSLRAAESWRIIPAQVENTLRRSLAAGTPTVKQVFDVKQGLLTGLNEAFIIREDQITQFGEKERRLFRPAIFRDAVEDGYVRERFYVFFPYNKNGLTLKTESDVEKSAPVYYQHFLLPNKEALQKRSGINDVSVPWWALSRYYKWIQNSEPRIVSKYFGLEGSFAIDDEARFIPLQAYAWFLRSKRSISREPLSDVLHAYLFLLNSKTFFRMVKVFSEPVARGQYNLSSRYVNKIPLPDLSTSDTTDLVRELAKLNRANERPSLAYLGLEDDLCVQAWGRDLVESLLEMDDV